MPLDAAQLASLIESHAGSLRLWVRTRSGSDEDVVQEAFCRLAAQEPAPDNPVAWLYRVCRNLAETQRHAEVRRRQREGLRAQADLAGAASDPLEVAEAVRAVEELDPELREVVLARVWGQLSLDEIGKLCGISTSTAFRRYELALKTLRSKLEQNVRPRGE